MADYARGTTISLVANYLDGFSRPILSGLGSAWIDLYYYSSPTGSKIFIANSGAMTQDTQDPNRFFYLWDIPVGATITNYVAEYSNMFSGNYIQNTEIFGVTAIAAGTGVYIGTVAVSGNVVDVSGTGIQYTNVSVTSFTGSTVLTSTNTDISGNYALFLDPDDYYVSFNATGYFPITQSKTVPTAVTNWSFGQTTLTLQNGGNLVISDTFQAKDPNTQIIEPLDNFKVSLYTKVGASLGAPVAITRTDASGTFTMLASAGEFVLRVEGTQSDGDVFNTSYDIVVNDAYALGDPKNFRYRGTSQYNYLL